MQKYFYLIVLSVLLGHPVSAQYTIHVLNPWASDTCAGHADSLRMLGNNTVGYYPGSSLTPEGANWFFYVYQTRTLSFQFVDWCGPQAYQGSVSYRYSINLDSTLMNLPAGTNEIWIVIPDTSQKPIISAQPPAGNKVVYFLSPWDIGAPLVQFKGMSSIKMKMDTSIALCGWFKYYYYGKTDSAQVKFTNSLDSTVFSSVGIGQGNFIDLSATLASSDTVWVMPISYPTGIPSISSKYPGVSAPCQRSILLGATLRDIDGTKHPDFNVGGTKPACDGPNHDYGAPTKGIVKDTLGPDGKPMLSPTSPCPVDSFNWFKTDTLLTANGVAYTNAKCFNLRLTKNADGLFQYDTAFFFPLDSFKFLDPNKQYPNPCWTVGTDINGFQHNYSFTMQLGAQFEYEKGQTFDFRGDDDVWVFINNRLAVDIGGIHNPMEGSVKLDSIAPLWGLKLGSTYNFALFFCERNCCGSSFRMVTSLNLRTNSNLFTTTDSLPGGGKEYDMHVKITQSNLTCDYSQTIVDTQSAVVDFYLTGPTIPAPTPLPTGTTSYGGITIPSSNTFVKIDTTAITGLLPGTYIIHYYLHSDNSQYGAISFTITALPGDHFDILADTMTLNLKKDAPTDSIVIGMFDSTASAYAVVRDINGTFLTYAANPTWISRNPQIAAVKQSSADSCLITKIASGTTWVVVTDPMGTLKPDSIKIVSIVLPKYPVIVSAIMLDTNADLIPDMLSITLNDTFKTNQRPDSIVITYRGNTYSIAAANAALNGTSIKASFTPSTGIDGRPTGQAILFMTIGSAPQISQKTFSDGVDPAIIAADVMQNDGAGPDTLFVTFSEPVQQSSVAGNQLLLIKAGTTDTAMLNILQVIAKTTDSTYTLQVMSASGQQPKQGDALRLLPGILGGSVLDVSKNAPNAANRPVVLGERVGPAAIIGAYYRDGNGDGFIDTVVLNFKRPVPLSALQMIVVKWSLSLQNIRIDTIALNTLLQRNDSSYSVPVHGENLVPKIPRTNVPMEIFASYTNFPDLPPTSAIVTDSAAPVLDSARLYYANSADSTTLTVMFSENVVQPGMSPFLAWSKSTGAQYQFTLTPISTSGNVCVFRVDTIIGGGVQFAGVGDSLWINIGAAPQVSDLAGNAQTNPLNRRVLFSVITQPPVWSFPVSKNPFTAGMGTTTEISAFSQAPIVDANQYSLSIGIFDIIGNQVIAMPMQPSGKGWKYSWDGRNRFSRTVGSGAYTAIVKIYKNNILTQTKRLTIGVKR
jgi:fibro-slime domain-containing protein